MWALVESGSVTKVYTRPRSLTIGDVSYPSNIFTMWSKSELEALGIYEVEIDNTNLKDQGYYTNTDQTFAFGSGKVTASYGSATAQLIADTLYTAQDETDGFGTEGEVKTKGLKSLHKDRVNEQAGGILSQTDWYSIRAADGGTAVPSSVSTHRTAVRTKANAMCTQIDNASDVDALAALYVYTNTGTEENPVLTRPLGEFPTL
tara:strand:+ start:26 stop:637 length:612 start_codon:yes stop_codon:yes gene_type:complete